MKPGRFKHVCLWATKNQWPGKAQGCRQHGKSISWLSFNLPMGIQRMPLAGTSSAGSWLPAAHSCCNRSQTHSQAINSCTLAARHKGCSRAALCPKAPRSRGAASGMYLAQLHRWQLLGGPLASCRALLCCIGCLSGCFLPRELQAVQLYMQAHGLPSFTCAPGVNRLHAGSCVAAS